MDKMVIELLGSSVEHFRRGEDIAGLQKFMCGMERLGQLPPAVFRQGGADMAELLAAAQKLLFCVQGGDITGLTDILEHSLYPAIRSLNERGGMDGPGK